MKHKILKVLRPVMVSVLLCLILVVSSNQAKAEEVTSTFCADLHEIRHSAIHWKEVWKSLKQTMRVALLPGTLSKMEVTSVEVPDDHLFISEISNDQPRRNIIFSIGPSAWNREAYFRDQLQEQYDVLMKKIKIESLKFARIYRASKKSAMKCEVVKARLGFDEKQFLKLQYEKESLRSVRQIQENDRAFRKFNKKQNRHLFMNWEWIDSTDINELHQVLSDPHSGNIILISHSQSTGKLIDSLLNEYPSFFFSNLSASIQSISIYSCFSQKVFSTYNLKNALLEGNSNHFGRLAIGIKSPMSMELSEQVAPISRFWNFLKHVDQEIVIQSQKNEKHRLDFSKLYRPTSAEEKCELRLSGLKLENGDLGFALNQNFLGAQYDVTSNGNVNYRIPCRFFDRTKNILIISSIKLSRELKADLSGLKIEIIGSDHTMLTLGEIHHFNKADGTYRSSRIELLKRSISNQISLNNHSQ